MLSVILENSRRVIRLTTIFRFKTPLALSLTPTPTNTSSPFAILSGRVPGGKSRKWKSNAPACYLGWGVYTMGTRLELQTLLETITSNVYFQPPNGLSMEYPCIVYKRDNMDVDFANDSPYRLTTRYLVTVIDQSPDSTIVPLVASLPMCLYNRGYAARNLNHDVFNLYF